MASAHGEVDSLSLGSPSLQWVVSECYRLACVVGPHTMCLYPSCHSSTVAQAVDCSEEEASFGDTELSPAP